MQFSIVASKASLFSGDLVFDENQQRFFDEMIYSFRAPNSPDLIYRFKLISHTKSS